MHLNACVSDSCGFLDLKGVLFMPNGDSLDGVFDGHWGTGLRVAGTFTKPFETLRREIKMP